MIFAALSLSPFDKMTSISLKMTTSTILSELDVILSVAQLVTTVIYFSAWDKLRVKWYNSKNSTQKMKTELSLEFYEKFRIPARKIDGSGILQ